MKRSAIDPKPAWDSPPPHRVFSLRCRSSRAIQARAAPWRCARPFSGRRDRGFCGLRAIRRSPALLGAENLVAIGYVFWLLLDLIQGAYDLRGAADWAIRDAFIAVVVSAAVMWVGFAGKPWKIPNWLGEIASRSMDSRTVARLVPVCFLLGMFNYAYATGFDLPRMFSYLGEPRWSAPWGRGQLGGWDAFLDQMQYFGYVLPSLTALLIARRGFTFGAWLSICCPASCWRSCRRAAAAASLASRLVRRSSSGSRRRRI